MSKLPSGSIVALVTPMDSGGGIDGGALRALLQWHMEAQTEAVLVAGTTGESPTLTVAEHRQLIADAVRFAEGRIPIMAGVGANATAEAVAFAKWAREDGADCGLSVVPYYNKPEQEGMFRHFSAAADAVDLPVYLYDIPGRCVVGLWDETLSRLAMHENIVGVKDATGDLLAAKARMDLLPDDFIQLSGDDKSAREYILAGGDGVVSVTANVAPKMMRAMTAAAREGDSAAAEDVDAKLRGFHIAQGVESNPIPVKFALADAGRIPSGIRLPMTPLAEWNQAGVRDAMRGLE